MEFLFKLLVASIVYILSFSIYEILGGDALCLLIATLFFFGIRING